MKRLIFPCIMILLCAGTACSDDDEDIKSSDPKEKNITITDASFKSMLVDRYDRNGDGEISLKEAQAVTSIEISTAGIATVKGIEEMPNLTVLKLKGLNAAGKAEGRLNTLDISGNQQLKELRCAGNQLKGLDISKNPSLETVDCSSNKISSLKLTGNAGRGIGNIQETDDPSRAPQQKVSALKTLYCQNNNITELDVSACPGLQELHCSKNQLTALDISANTNLKKLEAGQNPKLEKIVVWKDFDKGKTEAFVVPETTVIQPSGQEPETPEQTISAVGFDTERPVKKISYYYKAYQEDGSGDKYEKASEMELRWQGKNILGLIIRHYQQTPEGVNKVSGTEEYAYTYEKEQITCTYLYDGKADGDPITIQLDEKGYAAGYNTEWTDTQAYEDDEGNAKSIICNVSSKYSVVRDAQYRVIRSVTKREYNYKPEDLKWLRDHNHYVNENREEIMEFKYDAQGNLQEPPFSQYTTYKNVNGFFIGSMHAFHLPRNLVPMGPYDLFHVVKTATLPMNFGHEFYEYEFDKNGYVTKVYDCRQDYSGDGQNPNQLVRGGYSLLEY